MNSVYVLPRILSILFLRLFPFAFYFSLVYCLHGGDFLAFFDALTDFIFVEDAPDKADLILVPGSTSGELALHAANLWHQGFSDQILVSGRCSIGLSHFPGADSPAAYQGRMFDTECSFLSQILLDEGVPEASILREDQASFTYENAIFSKLLTDRLGIFPKTAILCCKSFHARRSLLYYQLLYPDTHFLVCPVTVQNITRDNWTQTPEAIDVVLGEVERCGTQFHQILREYRKG